MGSSGVGAWKRPRSATGRRRPASAVHREDRGRRRLCKKIDVGLVTPRDVVAVTLSGKSALLFLAALLPLSALVEASGFFEWAAIHAARGARGDGRALYRDVFLLGSAVTVALSLDTTAVMLTPLCWPSWRGSACPPVPTSSRAPSWPTPRRSCCPSPTSPTSSSSRRGRR
jgi:Arsenical pump membrane protein